MRAITNAQFTNAMISAFEAGSAHWVVEVEGPATMEQYRNADGTPWYSNPAFWLNKSYSFKVTYDETDGFGELNTVTVTWDNVKAGMQILHDKYLHHYTDLVTERDDSDTADALFQCIVLKEIVYG